MRSAIFPSIWSWHLPSSCRGNVGAGIFGMTSVFLNPARERAIVFRESDEVNANS